MFIFTEMNFMRIFLWFLLGLTCIVGCKEKKVDLGGDDPVEAKDFFSAFPVVQLSYQIADSNISKKTDTTVISKKVLLQFIPDSAFQKLVPGKTKVIIHPVAQFTKGKETYLLLNCIQYKIQHLSALVFDEKLNFLGQQYLFNTKKSDGYNYAVNITREPTFIISKEKLNKQNELKYMKIGYAYISDQGFMTVLNDTNEDLSKTNDIINPLDTLPQSHKLSGDYIKDKRNFISIRDGKNINTYIFFLHFEKQNGKCIGEVKGDLKVTSTNKAIFRSNGDPCVIDFAFSGNSITVKEQGNCGKFRGIDCLINERFTKKKSTRKKK